MPIVFPHMAHPLRVTPPIVPMRVSKERIIAEPAVMEGEPGIDTRLEIPGIVIIPEIVMDM
jgi:hypothetical protein